MRGQGPLSLLTESPEAKEIPGRTTGAVPELPGSGFCRMRSASVLPSPRPPRPAPGPQRCSSWRPQSRAAAMIRGEEPLQLSIHRRRWRMRGTAQTCHPDALSRVGHFFLRKPQEGCWRRLLRCCPIGHSTAATKTPRSGSAIKVLISPVCSMQARLRGSFVGLFARKLLREGRLRSVVESQKACSMEGSSTT